MSIANSTAAARVWTNPDADTDLDEPTLVRLTADALCLAVVPAADLDKTVAALNAGEPVAAKTIPLATIERLHGDEDESELVVSFKQGVIKTEEVTITLADANQRNELMAALADRLGPDWKLSSRRNSRFKASLWPIGCLAIAGLLTWLMYDDAVIIAAGGHVNPGHGRAKSRLVRMVTTWLAGLLGPTGVIILGVALAVLCVIWLGYAVAKPPTRVTVERSAR
jgi:hypothetical protein